MPGESSVLWLLPAAFIVHDGEEVLTMPRWIAEHQLALQRVAELGAVPRAIVANLPTTTREVAAAVCVVLVVLVMATLLAQRRPRGAALHFYAALLGAFAGHAFSHIAGSITLREYTPGVVTAVLVIPPAGWHIYGRLCASARLTRKAALASAAVGIAAMAPLVIAAHCAGRALAR